MFDSLIEVETRLDEALHTQERVQIDLTIAAVAWIARSAWLADGSRSPKAWLVNRRGVHPEQACRLIRRARIVANLDLVDELDHERLTIGQADALAAVIGNDPDRLSLAREQRDLLLGLGTLEHLADFDRALRHWRQAADDRIDTDPDRRHARRGLSMHRNLFGELDVEGRIDAESADVVESAMATFEQPDPPEVERTQRQRNHDAFVDVCRHALGHHGGAVHAGSRGRGEPVVIFDHTGAMEHQGRPVGPIFGERICCDARFAHAWRDRTSAEMRFGTSRRFPTDAQRRAVIVRDRHCRFPGCRITHPACQTHHLEHSSRGGPTDLDNLTLLCRWHHRLVHEGGWTLRGSPNDALTARSPTGRLVSERS